MSVLCHLYSITFKSPNKTFLTPLPEYGKTRQLPNPKLSLDVCLRIVFLAKKNVLKVYR